MSEVPLRSRDDIRDWIACEVQRLRGDACQVDTAAPVDALGVDSLGALMLAGDLAQFIGRDVPATLMWDHATIDAIAHALGEAPAAPNPGIVRMQPLGERQPLFFFPGLGGHPVSFAALAAELAPQHPCFGLTLPGLDGLSATGESVAAIAAELVRKLQREQPRGPYQLMGYSFGGYLAFEAACQLADVGERVSLLGLLDTYTPDGMRLRPLLQRAAIHGYRLVTRSGRLQYLRQRRWMTSGEKSPEPASGAALAPAALNPEEYSSHHAALAQGFTARPYAGRALLFRARERPDYVAFHRFDPYGGWAGHCRDGVQVIDVPGTHVTMLDAVHAALLASVLRSHLG